MSGHQVPVHPDVGEMTDDEVLVRMVEAADKSLAVDESVQQAPSPQSPAEATATPPPTPPTPAEAVAPPSPPPPPAATSMTDTPQRVRFAVLTPIPSTLHSVQRSPTLSGILKPLAVQPPPVLTSPNVGVSVATDELLGRRCKARPQPPPFPPPGYLCTPHGRWRQCGRWRS